MSTEKNIEKYSQLIAEFKFNEALKKRPKKNGRPKGRRKTVYNTKGYAYVESEGKLILKHRSLMEQKLGRKLLPHEAVYFKDKNKNNFELSNLILGVKPGYKGSIICPHCSKDILNNS